MRATVLKWRSRLRRRQLASISRAGSYARDRVWTEHLAYARRKWRLLVLIALLFPVLTLPLSITHRGWQRGAVIGAAAATGVWSALLYLVIHSGTGPRLMSISAEQSTVSVLLSVRRLGWRFVTGIKVKDEIDHVAVGPPGVFVLETMWAAEPWPLGTADGPPFMQERAAKGAEKVHAGARAVAVHEYFKRLIGNAPIRPVLVLWSPSADMSGRPKWHENSRGVTSIQGVCLREWLGTFDSKVLDDDAIERIMSELVNRANRTDAGAGRPTMDQLLIRVMVEAPLSGLASAYLFAVVLTILPGWLFPAVSAAMITAGVRARHRPRLRAAATGWILGSGLGAVALVVVVLLAWFG